MDKKQVPLEIWNKSPKTRDVYSIMLSNGLIVDNVLIDSSGIIEGKVVGGRDGLDDQLNIQENEITNLKVIKKKLFRDMSRWVVED